MPVNVYNLTYRNLKLFTENQAEFDQLSAEIQHYLAEFVVLECPKQNMEAFNLAITAAKPAKQSDSSFWEVLHGAYQVKTLILDLIDSNGPVNYKMLSIPLDPLLQKFTGLASSLIKGHETDLAERLVLTTPQTEFNALQRGVDGLFPDSTLLSRVNTACSLHLDIRRELLGANPENFFRIKAIEEFGTPICTTFSKICTKLLTGKEQAIVKKLFIENPLTKDEKCWIETKVRALARSNTDSNNPFKIMHEAMSSGEKKTKQTDSTNPHSLYAPQKKGNKKYSTIEEALGDIPIDSDISDESDEEPDDSFRY